MEPVLYILGGIVAVVFTAFVILAFLVIIGIIITTKASRENEAIRKMEWLNDIEVIEVRRYPSSRYSWRKKDLSIFQTGDCAFELQAWAKAGEYFENNLQEIK